MRSKLPKTISPCPIVEAVVEIRFFTSINANAVFGIFYNTIRNTYTEVEELPILQIPDLLRNINPQFEYQPYYKLKHINDPRVIIQVGPSVITINSIGEYIGWTKYLNIINEVIEQIFNTGIIQKVERIGIRYINYFDFNIFEQSTIQLQLEEKPLHYNETMIKSCFYNNEFKSTLQIGCDIQLEEKKGSIIDIDVAYIGNINGSTEQINVILQEGHIIEKELFFSLLQEDFINKLNTEY